MVGGGAIQTYQTKPVKILAAKLQLRAHLELFEVYATETNQDHSGQRIRGVNMFGQLCNDNYDLKNIC